MTRPGYAVVYVILLCAFAKLGSEGKRWKPENFYAQEHGHLHVDVTRVEQVWKHCRKELIERNNDFEDHDLLEATEFLSPHMEQKFLDCIRKINPQTSRGLGRYLLAKSPDDKVEPSPSPAPSPKSKSESPPPSRAPTPDKSPSRPPKPPHGSSPVPQPPPSPLPPPPHKAKPLLPNAFLPKQNRKQMKSITIGAILSGIIVLIGLLLCCLEIRKSRKAFKGDSPLVVLSSSDMSGSQKPAGLRNSNNNGSGGVVYGKKPSFGRNLSLKLEDNNNVSLAEASTSESKGQVPAVSTSIPPPPPPPPPEPTKPPPPPPHPAPAPHPPPPPRVARPPPAPPKPMAGGTNQASALRPVGSSEGDDSADAPKAKLKPFFWDKVAANPDQAMVWHEINAGSFQFNEEKIESLFGCANQNRHERRKDAPSLEPALQYIQIIDAKKAQNLSILLRALNVTTEEVVDALQEGNEIPVELIQTLLKMAPTMDEELKLRLYTGDISQLGPAERFLKVLVDIPFAFKRLESLLFMFTLPEETTSIKEFFSTLEVSCDKLRKSRLFLKLLEAVLKTGNRMNDGTYRGGAQAFRLDTLLKLADVKGTDGKTTLLHFVVQEIIRSEGVRSVRTAKASQSHSSVKTDDFIVDHVYEESEEHYRSLGLQVVSGLSSELEDVKKAAIIDGDALTASVLKLDLLLRKSEDLLNTELKNIEEESQFQRCLESFVERAKGEVSWLTGEEKRIMAEVKRTADYFHGKAGKDEGLRLFVIVRDFLVMLDKVCKEVKETTMKSLAIKDSYKKEAPSLQSSPSTDTHHPSPSDVHRRLFPAIAERRIHDLSSDDDEDDDER